MQWSSPEMVDKIYEYIPNLHGNHTLCYFRNDCRIWNQRNPSEAPQKSENSKSVSNHHASCCPVTDVFFVKRLESQGNNMLKT